MAVLSAVAAICYALNSYLWERREVKAAAGDAEAQYRVGTRYYQKHNYRKALWFYSMAAKQGEPRAESAIGYMYQYGSGVPQDCYQAFSCYSEAVKKGLPEAQERLGRLYECGMGTKRDMVAAIHLYQAAEKQGNLRARSDLKRINGDMDIEHFLRKESEKTKKGNK